MVDPQIILDRLVLLSKQIDGIVDADDKRENAIGQMPKMIVVPATGIYTRNSRDIMAADELYTLRLVVSPYSMNTSGAAEKACHPFLMSVPRFFAGRPTLGRLPNIKDAWLTTRGQITQFKIVSSEYLGLEWTLKVTTYEDIVYATGE